MHFFGTIKSTSALKNHLFVHLAQLLTMPSFSKLKIHSSPETFCSTFKQEARFCSDYLRTIYFKSFKDIVPYAT